MKKITISLFPLRATGPIGLAVAVALGICFVSLSFPLSFVLGVSGFWQTDVDDVAQYISGFHHYFASPWQLPLLHFDSLDYPQGTRATFLDVIPLYAVLLKALLPKAMAPFNPYGFWVALCFILQSVGGWWLVREHRANSWALLVGLALTLLFWPALMGRLNHISLLSHWILLFALALYVRGLRRETLPVTGWTSLLLTGFYINIYLFVMAAGVYLAAGLALGAYRHWRSLAEFVLPFGLLVASLFVTLLPISLADVKPELGFGVYSMNLLAPFLGGRFVEVQATVGSGQYEGFNYLGLGLWIAFALALRLCSQHDGHFFRRHWPLALLMGIYAIYSLSDHVYFGSTKILELHYPEVLRGLTAQFRASGRFFWAVGYCIVIFSLLVLYRRLSRRAFLGVVVALICLQLADVQWHYAGMKGLVARETKPKMDYRAWDNALNTNVAHLYFYPKFKCGKHSPHDSLLPIMRFSGERQYTLNTGHIARYVPRCDDIAEEIGASDQGASAYIFLRSEFKGLAEVKSLLPKELWPHCIELDFAFVCAQPG